MSTVQDCINGLKATYTLISDAQALVYFNQVHRELIGLAQIQMGSEEFSLVGGQADYVLSATEPIVSVRSCRYVASASLSSELAPVSTDWLDRFRPGWRTTPQPGTPEVFYIESFAPSGETRLGLYPEPNQGAVGGYPKVVIYGPKYKALIATDQVPTSVPSIRVYIDGMKRLAASDTDVGRFDEYEAAYRSELHKTLLALDTTIEDLEGPRLVPVWMKNRPVI